MTPERLERQTSTTRPPPNPSTAPAPSRGGARAPRRRRGAGRARLRRRRATTRSRPAGARRRTRAATAQRADVGVTETDPSGRGRGPRRATRSRRTDRPAPAGRGRCPSGRRSSPSPIGIPFGYSELSAPALQPAVTISSPTLDDVLLAHAVEHERLARAARVAHDPGAPVLRSTRRRRPPRRSGAGCGRCPTSRASPRRRARPASRPGRSTRTPLFEPAATTIACVNALGRAADHLGGHRVEVGGEARAVEVVEELAQVDVLLQRELALDRALPELAHLPRAASRPPSEPKRLSAQP